MWGNYALALYRTLRRHKLYAALNTLGLALGLAVCATLFLVVRFESSFDRQFPNAERTFRVNAWTSFPGRPRAEGATTQGLLLEAMRAEFPQIETGARLWPQILVVRSSGRQAFEDVVLADPEIFDVFRLRFRSGDAANALPDLNSLVVSQTMARKYFGTEQAVGRTLTVTINGQPRTYRVTGVIADLPENTHLKLGLIGRFDLSVDPGSREFLTRWGSTMLYTYVRLRSAADREAIAAGGDAFVDRRWHDAGSPPYSHEEVGFRLVALPEIHFADARNTEAFKPGADPLFVGALGTMGLVTLLVAIVNYVSLATARAGMRAREVAVRKVMGATRRALIIQFVGESLALTVFAGLVAAALVEAVMPGVSAMLGQTIPLRYFGADGLFAPLAGLCLAVGLLSGVYPALVLSGFRPAAVLASARTPGGGRAGARVREGLAIGQFAIAICLMICTAVVFAQIQFVRNADLGFRRDGLILVKGIGEPAVAPQMRGLVAAFRELPGVVAATASERRPATPSENNGNMNLLSNPKAVAVITRERMAPDYAKTYGLRLVAGRQLGLEHSLDDRAGLTSDVLADRGLNVVINETAARVLGFTDPRKVLGQRLRMGSTVSKKQFVATIVGVAGDVRFLSPRTPIPPQVYMQDSHFTPPETAGEWSAAVRVAQGDEAAVTRRLEGVWRAMAPGVPFRAETVNVAMKPFYDPDARRGQLFATGSALSAVIACLGLYGLAAFNTGRRTKEIGIRKTLGGSTADVLRLLIAEFLRPVLWANLIAWPVAWLVMRSWLAGFDQRIDLNPAYFLAPTIAAIVVAIATVADQAIRVARAEPARALRYE